MCPHPHSPGRQQFDPHDHRITSSTGPAKPSKSQQKKAAKHARTEKRKQLKAATKVDVSDSAPIPEGDPVRTETDKPEAEPVTEQAEHDQLEAQPDERGAERNKLEEEPDKREVEPDKLQEEPRKLQAEPHKLPAELHKSEAEREKLEAERSKKRQNMITRTLWTFIMIGGFVGMKNGIDLTRTDVLIRVIGLLLMGHAYMMILVMLCQALVYREVTALFSLKDVAPDSVNVVTPGQKDPWSKTLNWYFFAVTNYFLYGESIIYYFKVGVS